MQKLAYLYILKGGVANFGMKLTTTTSNWARFIKGFKFENLLSVFFGPPKIDFFEFTAIECKDRL